MVSRFQGGWISSCHVWPLVLLWRFATYYMYTPISWPRRFIFCIFRIRIVFLGYQCLNVASVIHKSINMMIRTTDVSSENVIISCH